MPVQDYSPCPAPPEETAEDYLMGRLDPLAAEAFEVHFIGCPNCAEEVGKTKEYIAAMERAAREIRRESES
jgi:anti-sigma factor RsiW